MSHPMRWIALVFALALLTAATVQAGPVDPRPGLAGPEGESLLAAARDWLLSRVRLPAPPATGGRTTPPPRKAGCGMDPDGHQVSCR